MPRTFKFSFPLPRRKSSSDKQPDPSPQRMYSDDADDFPLSSPGVKAEQVLGTSEYNNIDLLDQPPRRSKRLRKHPSFMSVTISDTGSDSVKDTDEEPLSGGSVSGDRSQHRPSITRNQPSSPLLGQSFSHALEEKTSGSDISSPRAHYSPSSSTLRSYYDPAKSPLAISQQTSASSARDMALRKGCPPVSSPLARQDFPGTSHDLVNKDLPTESVNFQRGRPQHIDISTLPPLQPSLRHPHVHSPHLYPNSPPQPSLIARTHKSISDRTKWLGWERRKTKGFILSKEQPLQSDLGRNSELTSPNHLAANKNRPPHNCFDGIEAGTFAGTLGPESELKTITMHNFPQNSSSKLNICRDSVSGGLQIGPDNTKSEAHIQDSELTRHSTSFRMDRSPESTHYHRYPSQPNDIRSAPSIRSQKSVLSSQSNRRTLFGMDLKNQSVLSLSSSEDESEESVPSNDRTQRHRIRESIDYADKGDEALVLSVERIKSIKPQPIVNVRSRRRSRSGSSEIVPPVPRIPARPMLSPRVSSMKWQAHTSIEATQDNHVNGIDYDWETANIDSRTSRSSRPSSQHKLNERESRMMVVTPDEEKLLEGMRRKRASIRHDHAADLQNTRDSITSRPKTAGEDKRTRYFDGIVSQSSPSESEDVARSLAGAYAASADDLTREIEYFPGVPEIPVQLRGYTNLGSSPKKSPSLSLTASDLVASTPTSRRSPITPPSGLGHLDAYSSTYAVSPSRSINIAKIQQERKRTVSSSVVVLDGAEQRAQQLGEEDEITGWAMNKW
ncbi:MAG: hypothetical protein HETSPECPRED_008174 [Heterodermia speciosa]|uniref:Uncharacterized protein n=1 Tax=Heterodermia speciosa TaxID=116794 RepID=A0A8H3FVZ3_9LECA|nr:MAG: hypothetical protein HETSPECPRED_008174 [Heterodermia speciosa]